MTIYIVMKECVASMLKSYKIPVAAYTFKSMAEIRVVEEYDKSRDKGETNIAYAIEPVELIE